MKAQPVCLLLLLSLAGCTTRNASAARIRSASDARQKLVLHHWYTEDFGGGTRLFASRHVFDRSKAMKAFAHGVRRDIDDVVLIAPEDSKDLLPELTSKHIGDVWILGEANDVETCERILRE